MPGGADTPWNAVTDITFSVDGNLFASTEQQGIYASANEGRIWANMSAPPYSVYAVTSGSVIVGGNAGTYTMDGEGILYGIVSDLDGSPIENARVETDLGKYFLTNYYGEWVLHHQAGWFDVTAFKTGSVYQPFTYPDVEVYNATFTSVSFYLNSPLTNISLSNNTIAENQPVETTIGYFTTTDPDASDSHTYTLVPGTGSTNNASFTISGSTLQSNAVFDYETKLEYYSIRVRTTDSRGAYFENMFTINVTDIDELADSDGDGMPDEWEDQYGLNPFVNDASVDTDGDSFVNLREYLRGTDPTDPNSHPPNAIPWLPLLLE